MGMDNRRFFETETSKPKSPFVTLGRFARWFRPYWWLVLLSLAFIIGATYVQVLTPELTGQAVDCYLFPTNPEACWVTGGTIPVTDEEKIAGLAGLVLVLCVLFVASSVFNGLGFYTMSVAAQRVLRALREKLFGHLETLSLGYYAEHEAGQVMSRVTNDIDTIQQVLGFGLVSVVSGFLLMVWIAVVMLQTSVAYALISLSVVPLMFLTTTFLSGRARKAFRKSRQQIGNVNAELQESLSGVREVQAFNREAESIASFTDTNAANRDANIRAASYTSALGPTLEALGYVGMAIVVVVGGLAVLQDVPLLGASITLGTVFAFLQYEQRFNQPVQQISVLWTNIQSAVAGGERIFSLMDTAPDIVDAPNAQPIAPIEGRVVFENVQAGYQDAVHVLRGINFTAEAGQTVAIVGPTGAGKTTIINLIPRFYDVTGGRVTIDGHDVRSVTMGSLRSQIGIVLQDTYLFSDSVMNNIRYGNLDASDDEVMAAAKLVQADGFIERLPEGYQTVLGERGAGLSQGQRQLLAIARVALNNPRILILDEATSSVDTRTERLIQRAFEQIMAGRTTFVIAHRLSTIRNADMVMMLRDGEIIERGKHTELLAMRGAYYELYMSQFRAQEAMVTGNGHSEPPAKSPGPLTPSLATGGD
ncbi:MAG: ABC transporter ATP-binding protein [Anaerolineae bacterium]|nr:ABC transporter ATP-binding protein [Anaerolineae bacterium]